MAGIFRRDPVHSLQHPHSPQGQVFQVANRRGNNIERSGHNSRDEVSPSVYVRTLAVWIIRIEEERGLYFFEYLDIPGIVQRAIADLFLNL